MKTIETKMPSGKSVSRGSPLWLLAFGIFLAARACLVPTVLAQTSCESYTFTTLAGNAGYGTADGTGSAARFGDPDGNSPTGVAVDSVGNVYVADTNHTIRKVTPAGVVTTLAGTAGIVGSADGMGNGARFNQPSGVALDSAGNVYVADSGNGTIRKVTPGGMVTTVAGVAGSRGSPDGTGSSARFLEPFGVAVDSAGNVYVADFTTIRKVTPGGVVTTMAGAGSFGSADGTGSEARFNFSYGGGVAVDSAGNVYVADSGNNTIRKVTPAGVVTTLAGLPGNVGSVDGTGSAARFYIPQGVAVDSVGNVYVADSGNGTIRKVTPVGVVTTLAGKAGIGGSEDGRGSGARFRSPRGIAVDSAGNVYVADAGANTIRKVTPAGVVTTLAGLAGGPGSADGTGSAARFSFLQGVAVDSAGNLYVADTYNNTIRKVTPAGVVTTLAGLAGSPGSADGRGSDARFNQPQGVAVDSAGNVYVADSGNRTIRKVTSAGVVTTLAGLAGSSGSADGTGTTARFFGPFGVAVDSAGNVYVADDVIRQVTPAGVVTTLADLRGSAVAVDIAGNLYLAAGNLIEKATLVGTNWMMAALAGATYGSGVAVDGAGNVYVADTDNNTIRKVTTTGEVTTLAGLADCDQIGNCRGGSADGMGSAAQFNQPQGVAVDGAGNVYVADTANNTIRKGYPTPRIQSICQPYTFTTLAGNAGYGSADGTGSAAQFNQPQGVAVASAGNVYVADARNATIRKVTPAGVVTTLAGKAGIGGSADGTGSDARFSYPSGVAVDGAGNVYVADTGNNTIRKVTPAGVVTTLAGPAPDEAGNPTSGSADGTGSAARFNQPRGVAGDSVGNVYVADTGNSTIRKVTPEGVVTTLVGLAGSFGSADGTGSAARFYGPQGVAVDSVGNVYVADSGNNTIRKVTPEGVVTTIAGLPSQYDNDNGGILIAKRSGSADGTGSAARFNQPSGIAVDSAGNVYVADQLNATIRKVTPAGVVGTLGGLAGISGSADGTGSDVRFGIGYYLLTDIPFGPAGVSVGSAGNVYVADTANNTIRKGYSENVPAVIVTFSPGFGFNGGQFGFNLTGPAGRLVVVEASSDLVSWLPIWTNTFAGALNFSDPQSGVYSNRFYRAHLP